MQRPLVTEYSAKTGESTGRSWRLPAVFSAPIRSDVVNKVHTDMSKNKRQANGSKFMAGHMTSAESWGTGRAVARIPRVSGGGTHRAGQAAFGNMARGGHMFSPKVIWRRWHRRINVNMKRYAVASALAASAVPALVLARGHRIQEVKEMPLVVRADTLTEVEKTKQAVEVLKKIGAYADVERVAKSNKVRAGRGKMRNRRHTQRLGPLVVYKEYTKAVRAFRNIPGINVCRFDRMNLLQLAPGNHVGRFVIWMSDAFAMMQGLFGSFHQGTAKKAGFHMPWAKMTNSDLARIINSESVQNALNRKKVQKRGKRKVNPLRNFGALVKLNPFAAALRRRMVLRQQKMESKRARIAAKKAKFAAAPAEKKAKMEARLAKRKANVKATEAKCKPAKAGAKIVCKHPQTKFLARRIFTMKTKDAANKTFAKQRKAFAKFLLA